MSDTPRTDALKVDLSRDTFAVFIEMREHARQLERDLAAANEQVEMVKDIQELLGVKSWHGCYAAIAELKEKLAAKPDVAGLVGAYDEARYHFEDWTGGADTPSKQAELKRRVDAKDAARQRIQDALLSFSAQLAEKKAECEGLRQDAERFQYLQNIPVVVAQQFFWNYSSRKERAKAIDSARKP